MSSGDDLNFRESERGQALLQIELYDQVFSWSTPIRRFTLNVCASNTIEDIKYDIFEKEGIPLEQQRLLYYTRNLEDGRPLLKEYYNLLMALADYNIPFSGTTPTLRLELRHCDMQILVKTLTRKEHSLWVGVNDTVADVKAMIQEVEGVLPDDQNLIFRGKHLNDDNQLLSDRNIQKDAVIHLVRKLRPTASIMIKTNASGNFELKVLEDDTIHAVKRRISNEKSIPVNHQVLLYDGTELKDNQTVENYIQTGLQLHGVPYLQDLHMYEYC